MNFFKSIFRKGTKIQSNQDFWVWFQKNEKVFHKVVKNEMDIEQQFLNPLSAKLNQLKDGFFFLTGMFDDNTVELIFTADGTIENIVFVEELVATAPNIAGWKFTALKPENDIANANVKMNGHSFNDNTLSFYANELLLYPDEIDITIVYNGLTEQNRGDITNGIYLFLEIYLGELNAVTTIDNLTIIDKEAARKDLMPIEKLKSYLKWREKEFIEKYEGFSYENENDEYAIMEATLQSGKSLIAIINTTLLNWDKKASHPWILVVEIKFGADDNDMPSPDTNELLSKIEEELIQELTETDGYLNIGRQTAKGTREIYFACKEFRKPSKVAHQLVGKCSNFPLTYEIYKDKYWQTMERFVPQY